MSAPAIALDNLGAHRDLGVALRGGGWLEFIELSGEMRPGVGGKDRLPAVGLGATMVFQNI